MKIGKDGYIAVVGYEDRYEINRKGDVRSKVRQEMSRGAVRIYGGNILTPQVINKDIYVALFRGGNTLTDVVAVAKLLHNSFQEHTRSYYNKLTRKKIAEIQDSKAARVREAQRIEAARRRLRAIEYVESEESWAVRDKEFPDLYDKYYSTSKEAVEVFKQRLSEQL